MATNTDGDCLFAVNDVCDVAVSDLYHELMTILRTAYDLRSDDKKELIINVEMIYNESISKAVEIAFMLGRSRINSIHFSVCKLDANDSPPIRHQS